MTAALSVRDLTVNFGALVAVNSMSFDAAPGRITSVIGPNGAGKSSLFNLISGAIRPTAGSVRLDGRDVTGQPPYRLLAAGLARSFQITNLFFELPVFENVDAEPAGGLDRCPRPRGLRGAEQHQRRIQ